MTSSTVKLLMAAGIAGAAMPQNLSAKEIILEGGDNAAVALSIYNNDLAFVRDSRTAALNAGRNSVAFKGVAEKIMPETAMLTGSQISVIEQNYNYNLLTPVNIVNESVGKTVKTAIDNLSLAINDGEIFGLLGPNGAGKTTLVSMLAMLMRPCGGEILYDGKNAFANETFVKSQIGVVPQHINFDQDLTVWENMELHGRLHHLPEKERHARIDELLEYVGLQERRRESIKALSGGMKRRLLIVRALIHRPKVLFLDEPTVALDPQVRRRIWDLIRTLHREGVTVVLTTHYIEEAENLCGRVAVINDGRLVKTGSPTELCRQLGSFTAEWDADGARQYRFFAQRSEAAAFAAELDSAAFIRRTNLEDVFIELTGRAIK